MIYKYTSVEPIIAALYRDNTQLREFDRADILEWMGEALGLIGVGFTCPYLASLTVSNYRAELPKNFHTLLQFAYNGIPLPMSSSTIGVQSLDSDAHLNDTVISEGLSNAEEVLVELETLCDNAGIELTDSIRDAITGTFPQLATNVHNGDEYTINDNYVFFPFETGTVIMAYRGLMVDRDMNPLVPDAQEYRSALEAYVQMKLDRKAWRNGSGTREMYEDSKRDWYNFKGKAQGKYLMPDIPKMEAIKNSWIRLIPRLNLYDSYFSKLRQ